MSIVKTNIASRLLWMAVLLLGMVVVIAAVSKKKSKGLKAIEVGITPLTDGYNLIDDKDILKLIKNSFGYDLKDVPMGELDIERVERVIENDPFVLEAEVFIRADDRLEIKVLQREPVLRLMTVNGENYYFDKNAVKMPTSAHFSARVLVAMGDIPKYTADFLEKKDNLLNHLFSLSKMILEDDFFRPLIEEVYVRKGEFILIPKLGKQKIIMGDSESLKEKMKRLKIFYKEALPYSRWTKYREIDVRFVGQVVAR